MWWEMRGEYMFRGQISDHWRIERNTSNKIKPHKQIPGRDSPAPTHPTLKNIWRGTSGSTGPTEHPYPGRAVASRSQGEGVPLKELSLQQQRTAASPTDGPPSSLQLFVDTGEEKCSHCKAWLATLRHRFPSWSREGMVGTPLMEETVGLLSARAHAHKPRPRPASLSPVSVCYKVWICFPLMHFLHKFFTGAGGGRVTMRNCDGGSCYR